jgi:hypothetical protein
MMKEKRMVILSHMIKIKAHLLAKFGLMMLLSQIFLKMAQGNFGSLNFQLCKVKFHLMDFGST